MDVTAGGINYCWVLRAREQPWEARRYGASTPSRSDERFDCERV